MGGLIVLDFIDMKGRRDQQQVYQRMKDGLRRDKAKTHILPISQLGLMEMTRQRHTESVRSAVYDDCPYCKGRGKVKSVVTMSVEIQRKLQEILKKRTRDESDFQLAHRRASDRAGTAPHRGRKTSHRDGETLLRQTVIPRRHRHARRTVQDRERGEQRGTGQRRCLNPSFIIHVPSNS
jgi:Ribonuclease G/E